MNSLLPISPAHSSYSAAALPAVLCMKSSACVVPAVPTLLATRMQMELLLAERSVDLQAAAELIRNDLGAALEIFRLAGCDAGEMPAFTRIEDCLAVLPVSAWMEAVSAEAVERVAATELQLGELAAFWERARAFAYTCWLLAGHTDGICPEQAYLVGLLRDAARLPALLGWPLHGTSPAQLAAHWQLPELFSAVVAGETLPAAWHALLRNASTRSQGGICLPERIA